MIESLEAKELINSMTTEQVTRILKESFEYQNPLTMSTTIKVLAKRGCYGDIDKVLYEYFVESGCSLQLNSAFSLILGQNLFDVRNADPVLGCIGRKICWRSARKEAVYNGVTFTEDLLGLNDSFPKLDPKNVKLSSLDLFAIKDDDATEETYKEYLEGLTARDIVSMKAGTYNAVVNGLVRVYMLGGDDRVTATKKTLAFMKATLKPQLEKLSKDTMMADKMRECIYRDLF